MIIKTFEAFTTDNNIKPIKLGTISDDVKNLQQNLTTLGFPLTRFGIDSKFGDETLGQTKSLFSLINKIPKLKNKYSENITTFISPETQKIISEMTKDDDVKNLISKYYEDLNKKIGNTDIIAKDIIIKNIENPKEFIKKVIDISKKLQINPNWLIALFYKESGIDPSAKNPVGGATGLIQFMPKTAKHLGTTVRQLRSMSGIEQLDYVYKYFEPYRGKINDFSDLYAINFYPYMINKGVNYVIGSEESKSWVSKIAKQNKGIDLNKDGQITTSEFKDYSYKKLPSEWLQKMNSI